MAFFTWRPCAPNGHAAGASMPGLSASTLVCARPRPYHVPGLLGHDQPAFCPAAPPVALRHYRLRRMRHLHGLRGQRWRPRCMLNLSYNHPDAHRTLLCMPLRSFCAACFYSRHYHLYCMQNCAPARTSLHVRTRSTSPNRRIRSLRQHGRRRRRYRNQRSSIQPRTRATFTNPATTNPARLPTALPTALPTINVAAATAAAAAATAAPTSKTTTATRSPARAPICA